jgi:hypothetical protein
MAEYIPDYAYDPLSRCLDNLLNMLVMLRLTSQGMGIVANRPMMVQRVIDLTTEAGKEVTKEMKADLETATKDAAFAENERRNEFPFMHASTLVAAWGSLEAGIEDMLVGISLNEPEVLQKDEFMKIRIPLARFEALEKEERIRFLVGEVERMLTAPAIQGVDTFEKVLQLFGLSGEVRETVKKVLWEMNHMRNVIVHRDSHADLRLIQACPWIKLKVGDRTLINYDKYALYHDAVYEYIKILLRRLSKRYDVSIPDWMAKNVM